MLLDGWMARVIAHPVVVIKSDSWLQHLESPRSPVLAERHISVAAQSTQNAVKAYCGGHCTM